MALLSSLVQQDVYKVEKALADLSDLGQHLKRIHKKNNLEEVLKREGKEEVCLGYLR